MTEAIETEAGQNAWESTPVRQEGDFLLEVLLDIWAWAGMGQTLTVVCGGVLVTGSPISEAMFGKKLQRIIEHVAESAPIVSDFSALDGAEGPDDLEEGGEAKLRLVATGVAKAVNKAVKQITDESQQTIVDIFGGYAGEEEREPTPRKAPRLMISLANARVYQSGFPVVELPIWRGRLDAVSSWWIGDEDGSRSQ